MRAAEFNTIPSAEGSNNPASTGWKRASDYAEISLIVWDISADANPEMFWIQIQGALSKPLRTEFFSGHKIVGESRPWSGTPSQGFCWRYGDLALRCSASYRATGCGTRQTKIATESWSRVWQEQQSVALWASEPL